MLEIDVAIGVVCKAGQLLICRRRQQDHLGGFWEFPGGKIEAGETAQHCLSRELREEVGIDVETLLTFSVIAHDYSDRRVRIYPFLCAHLAGEATPIACSEIRWIAPSTLSQFEFPPANDPLIRLLERTFTPKSRPSVAL